MIKSKKTKTVDWIIVIFALLAICICIFPVLNVMAVSLSSNSAITNNKVFLLPVEFTTKAYSYVLSDASVVRSLFFTTYLTLVCTVLSMVITILCAYPLAQTKLVGKKAINIVIIITMYFNAGIIPDYLNVKNLNLLDNFWVLVIPSCLSVFNMIILKTFFRSIPESLKESAKLDGATHWTILSKIYLPLSTPVLATLALFYAVGRWNGFQDALFYISNRNLYTIQLKLYQIVNNLSSIDTHAEANVVSMVTSESMKAATVMFATVPILLIYPWLQRYFIEGATIGAVKG
ncbi:ABC transporter permease subunit [Anaerocolumna sedimenticola]|uniref:ABC transporter permease subunit n=1 Tax=Anaerocolumna sedimenticola TaxID=2696063 RepID=A0A6P1TLI8_9FIRM|nr:carbohydrate ABC transporter permease [Anaerocolumna sedimenticola]QHQ60881.1 ABC transporter permease subunit [Anaerocolumna sedimenticola]